MEKRPVRVIVVTDGDGVALDAVQTAAAELGLRTISRSAGHPTRMTGFEMASLSQYAPYDPVVVMVDDRGNPGEGPGERALAELVADPRVEVLGVVAVAARTDGVQAAPVDRSVSARGEVVPFAVDKEGRPQPRRKHLAGDTVSVLNRIEVPIVIGTGDSGKGRDAVSQGAPITRRAIEEILRHHGIDNTRHK